MRLLILGGTGDGKRVAQGVIAACAASTTSFEVIYSLAGLVRMPPLDCEIVSGGFRQFGGLDEFIRQRGIQLLLDCSHPYAVRMSTAAVRATALCAIPCWRLERPAWQAQAGDNWKMFSGWNELLPELSPYRSVLITSGQLPIRAVDFFSRPAPTEQGVQERIQQQLLRTAVAPEHVLPSSMQWLKSIGPFELDGELTLMRDHAIDCVISKNSGGEATEAKLTAARMLGIPVLMLARESLPPCDLSFDSAAAAQEHIEHTFL